MSPEHVNWLGALVAALSMFLVGGLWYSPILFQKRWMALNRFSAEDMKQAGAARIFGGSFALALVAAINLAFFLADGKPSLSWGVSAGLLAGAGWVATGMGITYLFERKPLALFLINAGYHVVSFALMGAILGAWKK